MRESMARLTPRFSASRTVREYTERYYLPASVAYHERATNDGLLGKQLVDWRHAIDRKWSMLRFGEMKVETNGNLHDFEVDVFLNGLDPNAVRVELYAEGVDGGEPVRQEMTRRGILDGTTDGYAYDAQFSATRPAADYTARLMPHHRGLSLPLELARILWQR
jgi:starch phosphorylase